MSYIAQGLNNYTKTYSNKRTGFSVGYYTVSQVKALYPQGDYQVAAQIGAGVKKNAPDTLAYNGKTEPAAPYKKNPLHRTAGYISCGEKQFVAVKKNIVWLWILLLILLLVLIFGIQYAANHWDEMFPDQPAVASTDPKGQVDQNIVEGDITLSTKKKIDTKGKTIKLPGITSMKFKAGQTEQEFVLRNPEGNPCYFKFQIILDKTGEILYESNLVPPGYAIAKFHLKRAMDAGSYKATVKYLTYSFDAEQNRLNNGQVKTTITVE